MITEFGFTSPLLIDEDNMILAGHGRTMAAIQLGFDELPAVVLRGMSEAQKRAIVIADNQSSELAGWDDALLKLEIGDLKKLDFDLKVLGFDDLQLIEFARVGGGAGQPFADPYAGLIDFSFGDVKARVRESVYKAFLDLVTRLKASGTASIEEALVELLKVK
jgi:hypothetical protein